MPVVKFLRRRSSLAPQRSLESIDNMNLHSMMSKTIQFDEFVNDDENAFHHKKSILTDDHDAYEIHFANPNTMKGLEKLNEFYIKPLLVRKPSSSRQNDEQEMKQHDRKPLLSSSNGKKSSLMDEIDNDDDDEDGEDDLLVVNQLRQENFQLKTINQKSKDTKRINLTSHNT